MIEEHIIKLFRTYYIGREWCLNCTILNTNAFSIHEALQRLKIRKTGLNKACKDGSFLTSLLWGKRWIFFSCVLAARVCLLNYGMLWAAVEPEIQSRYWEQKDQENSLRVCSWDGLQEIAFSACALLKSAFLSERESCSDGFTFYCT